MKRKLLSVFLSLAMVLTMMPVFAMADSITIEPSEVGTGGEPSSAEGVAKIGDETYDTLNAAVAAATDGVETTIIMQKDTTETVVIESGKKIVLDLDGHNITAPTDKRYDAIVNDGTLTIKDSKKTGKIISEKNSGIGVNANSNTTIEYANVQGQEGAVGGYKTTTGAKVTINDGVFTGKDNAVVIFNGSNRDGEANEVTINGGTFKGEIQSEGYIACGIYAPWKDKITVNGGTFDIKGGAGIVARAGNVTITGGEFKTTTNTTVENGVGKVGDSRVVVPCSALVFDSAAAYPALTADSNIAVTGGKFTSEVNTVSFIKKDTDSNNRIVISGGTFSSDITEYCEDNYVTEKNDDNTYTVKSLKDVAVAQIGENGFYKTIQDAVNAAENDATITLLKDTTTDMISIENGKYITLNTNGKTITNGNGSYAINNKGTLTINGGGKIVRKDAGNSAIRTIGTLNLENITVETSNNKIAVKVDENGISNPHGILNVGEGTVLTAKDGQAIQSWGDVTINGGTMNGEVAAWSVKDWNPGKITINNVTINGDVTAYQRLKDGKYPDKPATINIINGMIDGASKIKYVEFTNNTIIERNKTNDEATGSITISGGYFNSDPTEYLVEGKVAGSSDIDGYAYKVVDKTENTIPAESEVTSVPVKTIEGADKTTEEAAKEVKGVAVNQSSANVIDAATKDLANKNTLKVEGDTKVAGSNETVVNSLKTLTNDESLAKENIALVYQSYIDVTVKNAEKSEDDKYTELTVDLTPMYRVVATKSENVTDNKDIIIKVEASKDEEANAVVVQSAEKLNLKDISYEVSLALPSGFAANGAKLSIKHVKDNGTVEYYTGTVSATEAPTIVSAEEASTQGDTTVTFTTNGFSPFTVYAESAASIGETLYPTLQAAVDAAGNNDTITVTKDKQAASVSGNKLFTIVKGDGVSKVELTAASGYNLTNKGNGEYSV